MEELDWSTGQILDAVEAAGIAEKTLVIWTNDNGAPILADGSPKRGINKPLYGRGYTTSEGAMRVPMIAWWPGKVKAGAVQAEMCSTMDLLPTFARLAGSAPPSDRVIDGKDIQPLLFGEAGAKSPHEAFYYYQRSQLQAVRAGKWKLFLPLEEPYRVPPHAERNEKPTKARLFNVAEDIASEREVAAQHPDVVERLMKLAEVAREELGDTGRQGNGVRPIGRFADPAPRLLK